MSSAATPTSPAIVCPDDDNSIDSQLIDGQLFQYLVQCDTDITDDNLAQYRYQTFTECAAACGSANYGFSSAVCQGAVFYPGAESGSNCFLKKSANSTVVAGGINAVILLRIEVAVNESSTPSAVYLPSSTASSIDTSSMLSSIFQNSTTSMPIITPAPAKDLPRVTQPMFLEEALIRPPKFILPTSPVTVRGTNPTTPLTLLLGQHLPLKRYLTRLLPRRTATATAGLLAVPTEEILLVDLPDLLLATRLEVAVAVAVLLLARVRVQAAPVATPSLRLSTTTPRPMETSRFATKPS
ncbi:unnamed protein product [Aureobasidium mustum]|uniref:Apple domain-containing protein n=1 Tax=Aureobasidium mustum TaxID=2773714 RepID=A0A9N8K6F6_9PEZI|nr:unnamed protein product [Aureobasidium mustum]